MRLLKLYSVFAAIALMAVSCGKNPTAHPWDPEWDKKTETDSTETDKSKPRYVWIDAAANFSDYENDKDKIATDLAKIKNAGFTDIIVDVRPTCGDVLFKSTVADALKKVDVWKGSSYVWVERTGTYDYLQAFIDEARKQGLKVNASINTFVGGYYCPYGLGTDGMLFRDKAKKSWASVINTDSGLVNVMDLTSSDDYGARFLNPANDSVQKYVLQIIKDLAAYNLDGIILDRCRYDDYGLQSDFSDVSKSKFETWSGISVSSWPEDVMPKGATTLDGSASDVQKKWLAFRAHIIHDFVEKAAQTVHSVNADIRFGVYVGAWYSTYYTSGVNWASPKYDPKADGYWWASSDYRNYGYADHCDFMFLGAYASRDSIWGSGEWTMQGFCKQGRELLKGDTVFSGGPDIGNSTGWVGGGQASSIPDAVKACINNSDGFFVFDLCHIKMYDYWDAFKKGFDEYLKTVEK